MLLLVLTFSQEFLDIPVGFAVWQNAIVYLVFSALEVGAAAAFSGKLAAASVVVAVAALVAAVELWEVI